mgnify:CR=1 FL=1
MTVGRKAKQLGLKSYVIHMGMFDYHVCFVIGDHKQTIKLMNWFHENEAWYDDGNEPRGQVFGHRTKMPVLWLPRKPQTTQERATLAHEACHVATAMFEFMGMPHDRSSDETYAHAVGHIVKRFEESVK